LVGHTQFSDKQIISYEFYNIWHFSKISAHENKTCSSFLYTGSNDPRPLSAGARGPCARPRWLAWPERPWPWPHLPETGEGRRSGAKEEGEKRAARPDSHRELAGKVSWARGWPAASNLGGGARITARKIQRIGGDFGHSGSILRARRRRAASGTFSASRRSKGRHRMAALGGSHGGRAHVLGASTM
jgi:hypothetical protein